ncbi:GNAT family N-acetyltransferase [Mycobacterium sp. shizuoka-1]|uniref:GNAT family N-acetyltransferase n=1 Tax=Mycobacterium sp. shizuoka-1 TaxID=2039281 RepID=UPI000C0635A0|nr:GNAT family N-acetyltransferase [Mycobacterium sp. shizuoka-1]GAY18241.1 N-acetyltransferase [Mycobacterium sp. shizuoka-1]
MTSLRFVPVDQDDELAQPLLAELATEYAVRYDGTEEGVARWLRSQPAETFRPPDGGMLIGVLGDRPVTGGAFCRFDDDTAELKRIWTDSAHRRRGYATTLLAALETEIARRGYRRVYLTTGNRQPEAEALYDSTGYRRLAEPLPSDTEQYPIAFVKAVPNR